MNQAYFHLVKQILSGVWAISEEGALAAMPIVTRLLNGEDFKTQEKAHETNSQVIIVNAGRNDYRIERTSSRKNGKDTKAIALIDLQGTVTKYSQWCGPEGTIDIANKIKSADANPEIDGILLRIDSPGGMVDGTNTLATTIKNAKKPILSYVDSGTMASAAYWIGSAAKEIWASENTDVIGSIGVMLSFVDVKGYYEKLGAKVHEIYATQSKDKNGDFAQARLGNYEPIQKNLLDKVATEFIDTMKAYRKDKIKEEALTGKIYMAQDALKVGLIDKIGNFDQALMRVAKLAEEQASNANNTSKANHYIDFQSNKDMNIFGKRWESLMAFLGFSFSASEDGKIELSESHADKLDASVKASQALEKQNADLQAEVESLKKANAELASANGTLQRENEALKASLDKKPAASESKIAKESDDEKMEQKQEDKTAKQAVFLANWKKKNSKN